MDRTWGLSPGTFALLYIMAALVSGAVVAARRRRYRGMNEPLDPAGVDVYDVAMMAGGPELVVRVALVNLGRAGVIALGDGLLRELARDDRVDLATLSAEGLDGAGIAMTVTVVQERPDRAHPVEAAVYDVVRHADSRQPASIVTAAAGSAPLLARRDRLAAIGVVHTADDVAWLQHQWTCFLPAFVAGALRLVVDLVRGEPAWALAGLLAATAVAMAVVRYHRPDAPRRRVRLVADLQRTWPSFSGRQLTAAHPELPMAMALGGAAPLWAHDRALALAIAAPGEPVRQGSRPADGGCGGCGGCGSSCSSCGGCGGCGGCG